LKILIAEDEKPLARALSRILENNHFSTDVVYNGIDALDYLELGDYDAAIIDIMMPNMDGIQVLKEIRKKKIALPILLLTAKSDVEDKVLGLDSGANYYLTKPFDTKELLAILRTITRGSFSQDSHLTAGNITLDRASFELSSPTASFKLANREFQIMEMLLSNPKKIIPTERFLEKLWGYDSEVEINVVWVYISYLRKKLTALEANLQIVSSRNAGYSLEEIE